MTFINPIRHILVPNRPLTDFRCDLRSCLSSPFKIKDFLSFSFLYKIKERFVLTCKFSMKTLNLPLKHDHHQISGTKSAKIQEQFQYIRCSPQT